MQSDGRYNCIRCDSNDLKDNVPGFGTFARCNFINNKRVPTQCKTFSINNTDSYDDLNTIIGFHNNNPPNIKDNFLMLANSEYKCI